MLRSSARKANLERARVATCTLSIRETGFHTAEYSELLTVSWINSARKRIYGIPISESAFIGAAICASAIGMRPIAELTFVDLIGVAYDQIINHMANTHYMSGKTVSFRLVLTTATSGDYGNAAQHSKVLYSTVAHIQGLKVVVNSTAYNAKGLMISSIKDNNPVVYMFHTALMGLKWMLYPETAKIDVPEVEYGGASRKDQCSQKGRWRQHGHHRQEYA